MRSTHAPTAELLLATMMRLPFQWPGMRHHIERILDGLVRNMAFWVMVIHMLQFEDDFEY